MDKLFEAFAQTQTGRDTQEGTGLGLPISRKFVRLMGGDMQVKSEVGRGTTFTYDILVHEVTLADIVGKQPVRRVIDRKPGQPRYRILIVDDNATNRRLLAKLLAPFGFEIREAANGQEAVTIWERWHPHLLWMDMRMPVLDGYEATKRIRKHETRNTKHEIPTLIIALTASVLEEERAAILSIGCDGFLRKPFREEEVFEILRTHLGARFVYEERQTQEEQVRGQQIALTPDALATLPDELLVDLQDAVEAVQLGKINSLIPKIHQYNAPLADALVDLVKQFRFDTLQKLFEEMSS
jgi:CheY-like chemotaxis protein